MGLVSSLVGATVCFVSLYVCCGRDFVSYMNAKLSIVQQSANNESQTLRAVLDLVQNNSKQITELSSALYKAQDENNKLSERVAVIEKELVRTQVSLGTCEDALSKCTRRK